MAGRWGLPILHTTTQTLLLFFREDVNLCDASLYFQLGFGQLAEDAVHWDRAGVDQRLRRQHMPLPVQIAATLPVIVYRRLKLMRRIVRTAGKFNRLLRLIIISNIVALAEHVIRR